MESSSSLNKTLFDPVRKKWVAFTPEEEIRQLLIQKMLEEGYPLGFLAVEKELDQLPHLKTINKKEIPKRRADIIAYAKDIHPVFSLYPLLMIECKAVALTPKFARQVIGYNSFVQAPFISMANSQEILTAYYDNELGDYHFQPGLPSYENLLSLI